MRRLIVAIGVMALAACSAPDQPGQLTADQDVRLNHAAEMLDANSVALEDEGGVTEGNAVGNEQ
ncbi:hypothetical protein [Sphingomonas sp. Mn802worker]|uniref:hypothetical protein n=1 Tax=Sphingomonas sp. Mn802worker TaxID=629773 RepID=UPI00037F936E|nr:hypothetical protein [Sphingomonas sp. Mn802worker]